MSLEDFYREVAPFLRGETSAEQLEAQLGPAPSGTADLAFYAELVRRNYVKILGELFRYVRAEADRTAPGLWARLVGEYRARTRVNHHDVNEYGREFPPWLAERREREPGQPAVLEELADYQWIGHLARHAPRGDDLGIDRRLFIRHYRHRVPDLAAAHRKARTIDFELQQPVTVLVYREWQGHKLRRLYASPIELGCLIEAATSAWPSALNAARADTAALEAARARLVDAAVFG